MRNIILFLLISLASGWIGVWIDKSIEPQAEGNSLGMGVWLLLPFLTSVFFRFFITNAWSDLKFNIQKNGKWYLLSLLIFPLTTLLILLLGNALGWVKFSNFQFHVYLASLGNILIPIFIKNILEEFAWRGYLTSRLAQFKMKDIWIYLIAGGTWGVWHFPYYLFFLPKSQMLANLPFDSFTFAIVGVFTMLVGLFCLQSFISLLNPYGLLLFYIQWEMHF